MGTDDKMKTALEKAASLKREVGNAEELARETEGIGGTTAMQAQQNLRETVERYEQSLRDVSDAKRGG